MSEAEALPTLSVYLIAGEPSGDFLGAQLMRAMIAQSQRPLRFYGVGGPKMEEAGLESLFPYHELAIMGAAELIPHLVSIFNRIALTVDDVITVQPELVVTIDSPGFCFRVVERLRKAGVQSTYVHYVAPSVWAYKPHRAAYCAGLYDHMLALLPFEPPYFTDVGLPCTFVGHPVVAETRTGDGQAFRELHQIPADSTIITVLPGSRKGEVKRHMPVFAKAIGKLAKRHPNLTLAFAVPEHVLPLLAPFLNSCPFRAIICQDDAEKKNAMAASQFAFVKSGTVAFEVAMAGVPMLIGYRMNALSVWYLKRTLTTRYANLMNILLQREAIPELLQERFTPDNLAATALELLGSAEKREQQTTDVRKALNSLLPADGRTPSEAAANTLLSLVA
jgi:lipid-A-disaccharide synthase